MGNVAGRRASAWKTRLTTELRKGLDGEGGGRWTRRGRRLGVGRFSGHSESRAVPFQASHPIFHKPCRASGGAVSQPFRVAGWAIPDRGVGIPGRAIVGRRCVGTGFGPQRHPGVFEGIPVEFRAESRPTR